jgi:CTP:molybdopterin cytidylyltransferase MocA
VERLVLDGFTVASHERRELQTSVERHLTELLVADGRQTWQARRHRTVIGGGLTVTEGPGLGKGIAESVHQALRQRPAGQGQAGPTARGQGGDP